jgi:hypothetical protein
VRALRLGLAALALILAAPAATGARVLLVGSYHGIAGDYAGIQAAVDAAHPGDWILVGPGDYKETGDRVPAGATGDDRGGAGVLITVAGLHLRGMDRNAVVVDGTRAGTRPCSPAAGDQLPDRNGILVYEADGTQIQNLTVCNFLAGADGGGNLIWWDGGGSTGQQRLGRFNGSYLSATSTFYGGPDGPLSTYGIYASNTYGPGAITRVYASNMADSSFYIGACPDCNVTLNRAHGQFSALGYSGTNSGGHLIIEHSEFDHNQSGIVTNSANNDDAPSPQDGACPHGGRGPTASGSCWVLRASNIHDNNNANVPTTGLATLAPVGTGVVIAGGRNDTVIGNRVTGNGAWGILTIPFPDVGNPPAVADCAGGTGAPLGGLLGSQALCYFDDFGNEIAGNTISGNGGFENLTNGDLAEASSLEDPGNCWHDNVRPAGQGTVTSAPPLLQFTHRLCGVPNVGAAFVSPLGLNVICDAQFLASLLPGADCPALPGLLGLPGLFDYPRTTTVTMPALPAQPSMAAPCRGVPANRWCS